jgi:hypothetical protein
LSWFQNVSEIDLEPTFGGERSRGLMWSRVRTRSRRLPKAELVVAVAVGAVSGAYIFEPILKQVAQESKEKEGRQGQASKAE